jgi:AcrR family transcriptional regulator
VTSHRPRNRKALIRDTAAELFLARGYHNVSVSDVAEALDIAPSALYHHYESKEQILYLAVLDALQHVDDIIRGADDLDDAVSDLIRLVLAPGRSLAVWEREARYLDADQREAIRQREREVVGGLAPLLQKERPELSWDDAMLVAHALVGMLGSRSQHRARLPRRRDEQLMADLSDALIQCPLVPIDGDESDGRQPFTTPQLRVTRRDTLLREAIRLFDERGYQSVTMADIGDAAGIVASGVYRHFSSKTAILVAAVDRGGQRVRDEVEHALSTAHDPRQRLMRLLGAHIAVTLDERHLVGILTNEADLLPDDERRALRRFERDYVYLWVETVQAACPAMQDAAELKIVIQAIQSMISFVERRASEAPGLGGRLEGLALALVAERTRVNAHRDGELVKGAASTNPPRSDRKAT